MTLTVKGHVQSLLNHSIYTSLCQEGGVAQMVERSLSMREVPGSIPGASIQIFLSLTGDKSSSWPHQDSDSATSGHPCAKIPGPKNLHRPGIEPGPPAWQASILPLNQRCNTSTMATKVTYARGTYQAVRTVCS